MDTERSEDQNGGGVMLSLISKEKSKDRGSIRPENIEIENVIRWPQIGNRPKKKRCMRS